MCTIHRAAPAVLAVAAGLAFSVPAHAVGQTEWVDRFEVWVGAGGWADGPGSELPTGFRSGVALKSEAGAGLPLGLEGIYGRYQPRGTRRIVAEYGANLTIQWKGGSAAEDHLFLLGRVGWHRRSGSDEQTDIAQDALAIGPEVGWAWPLSDVVRLLLGLDAGVLWYADARDGSRSVPDSGGLALRWGLRLGINLGTPFGAGLPS